MQKQFVKILSLTLSTQILVASSKSRGEDARPLDGEACQVRTFWLATLFLLSRFAPRFQNGGNAFGKMVVLLGAIMKTFKVSCRRYDRREGNSDWMDTKLNATSPATAVARGVREYMKGLTKKERRDAAKLLEVRVTTLAELQEAPQEVYAAVDKLIGSGL
jgi:hypothetical protein